LGILTISRAITVGSFQMYLQAIYSFQGSLTGLVSEFLDLYENFLFVTDLIWFINTEPKITSGKKKFPDRVRRGLEFRDVWFRYKPDQPWILKGINLQLAARENLAIVGENGAGKTTLIKLLCRFYDPQKGEILVDGINLKEFDRSSLWKNLTVLFQNFEGFPFTARESIGYGRVENVEDIALVTQSAKQSTIHEFIAGLPLRYENPLTTDFEKGVEPSGGQWQRIGLARVLFRRAQVVILDEPTSNVDPKSEEEIFEKIMELTAKKNLILISHRFSTVRRANKICVIDKGQITEMGTHEELIKKRKLYAELFNLQAKAYH
ncbi:ABC transporter ATP-binding protein, partial [Candidatus Shapirobacteria bacterium]|nr:ABC transporter ATP-binding protein [Candidatus Shapirobacteria bacterium]